MARTYDQLIQDYLTSSNPQAAFAELLALQTQTGGLPGSAPALNPFGGPAPGPWAPRAAPAPGPDFLAAAQASRYGTQGDPLTLDPTQPGRLVPMSEVKSALDTPAAVPPAPNPLTGMLGPKAAQGPMVMTLRSGSGSRTVHAPEYPPQLLSRARQLSEDALTTARIGQRQQLEQVDDTGQLIAQWQGEAKLAQGSTDKAARAAADRAVEAGRELEQQRQAIRSNQIDPFRLVRQMPKWQQAMTALSVAIGGFVEGFSGGKIKNTGLAMLNHALEQDFQGQRDQLQIQMTDLQLSERQQRWLWDQYDKRESEKKAAVLRMTQLEVAKLGLGSQRMDVRQKTSDLILGIKKQLLDVEAKTIPKVTRQSGGSSHQVLVTPAQLGAGKAPPNDVIDMAGQARGVMEQIGGIQKKLQGYSLLGSKVPWNSESKRLMQTDIKPLSVELARLAGEKGPLANEDIIRAMEPVTGGWNTAGELSVRLGILRQKIATRIAAKLAGNAAYFNVAPLAQQLAPYLAPQPTGGEQQPGFRSQ